MNIFRKYVGNYPGEYNRAVHGRYDPSVYYGPRDTPLSEVKLNELFAWINRRNFHPLAMTSAISRAYYRYTRRFVDPKYSAPVTFYFQGIVALSCFCYLIYYPKSLRHHKQMKYHW